MAPDNAMIHVHSTSLSLGLGCAPETGSVPNLCPGAGSAMAAQNTLAPRASDELRVGLVILVVSYRNQFDFTEIPRTASFLP